ncbi:MAG: response regulator transcription factor, partial [Acidobacteria bacterium]|nr:response regulator transcription factor [Acidobacteriota bacterium]
MKVLVVEDSDRLRRSLGDGLTKSGFSVDLAADGHEALAFIRTYDYDVVVLDLMLPGQSGLEVLRQARDEGRDLHVLVLSARDQVADRIRGLEMGADDYLIKPFDFGELVARLRALVRRRYACKNPRLRVGRVEVDTAARCALRDGEPVHLTPGEYAVLELLVRRSGTVLSQDQILDSLHGGEYAVSSNVVQVLISSLR